MPDTVATNYSNGKTVLLITEPYEIPKEKTPVVTKLMPSKINRLKLLKASLEGEGYKVKTIENLIKEWYREPNLSELKYYIMLKLKHYKYIAIDYDNYQDENLTIFTILLAKELFIPILTRKEKDKNWKISNFEINKTFYITKTIEVNSIL